MVTRLPPRPQTPGSHASAAQRALEDDTVDLTAGTVTEVAQFDPADRRRPSPGGRGLLGLALVALLAPYAVVQLAAMLPLDDSARLVVVVLGWLGLSVAFRYLERRGTPAARASELIHDEMTPDPDQGPLP